MLINDIIRDRKLVIYMYRKTYVEVNLNNVESNIKNIINNYPGYDYYFGVVKGFSYSHGNKLAKYITDMGINYLCVSSLEEGIEIRKYTNTPILCLEPISVKYIPLCIENNITITLSSMNYFNELKSVNTDNLKIHLKVNSGMNRLGFKDKNELLEVYNYYKNNIEGIFSHFATSGLMDKDWDNQLDNFKEITSLINLNDIKIVHLGRSLTLLNHEKIDFCNGVRLGIVMYGYNQTPKPQGGLKGKLREMKRNYIIKKNNISKTIRNFDVEYKECFSLCSEVIEIQNLKKGDKVSYGGTYIASGNERICVIPIGYADGYNRRFKNFKVSINNKIYPLVGEVCMGMVMAKIDDSVNIHDKVYLIGNNISVREASRYIGTTVYETMCAIKNDLPRVYIKDNMIVDAEE